MESMGNSTAHLSCPNLILWPSCQFTVRGRFGEAALQWASLHLICLCLNGRSDDRESEWRGMDGTEKWRCRKRSTDSESEKKGEWLIIVWALTVCIHSGRKSTVYWLYYPSMCDLSGCACLGKWWEVSDSMQIGQAGKFSWDVNLCLRVMLKSVVVLSVGIPTVACTPAIWRGSDGVEDRFGCCLTLSFSSPLSLICWGNQAPRCREKGRVGVLEENPADWETEIGRK